MSSWGYDRHPLAFQPRGREVLDPEALLTQLGQIDPAIRGELIEENSAIS